MPKEHRKRNTRHDPPVKLAKREFALQDNAVAHITIGGATAATGTEVLQSLSAPMDHPVLRKKEKMHAKRDAFLQQLVSSNISYSKSHQRRMKRKAREQIASGLGEMQVVIDALDDSTAGPSKPTEKYAGDASQRSKAGMMIGMAKKTPLTGAQRKRALQLEQVRHPLILTNPHFAANPFQTIRTHAQNTLVKRQVPEIKQ